MNLGHYLVDPAPDEYFYSDLASDFIEEVVGSDNFSINWKSKPADYWKSKIDQWLRLRAIKAEAEKVMTEIVGLAKKIGASRPWINTAAAFATESKRWQRRLRLNPQ